LVQPLISFSFKVERSRDNLLICYCSLVLKELFHSIKPRGWIVLSISWEAHLNILWQCGMGARIILMTKDCIDNLGSVEDDEGFSCLLLLFLRIPVISLNDASILYECALMLCTSTSSHHLAS
jgi:hypothetical protein